MHLLINAPLLKPLLGVLRFVELSAEELTMLAQVMWEEEKQYQPQPVPRETTDSGEGSD